MEWQEIVDIFARMPEHERATWWRVAAAVLALMGLLLWMEASYFHSSNRVRSWAVVRLLSVLAAALTAAVVIVPAQAIAGPAALGVFILALYTAAPLVWFGSHVAIGKRVQPALSRAESLVLGVTGLAFFAIPVMAYLHMEGPLRNAAREIALRRELPANNPPLLHTIHPVQRFNLPGSGLIYTQSLIAAPDTRLVRVEHRKVGQWPTELRVSHPMYCTNGNDVHLMWSAQEQPPYLRLHWAQSNGTVVRSEFTPQMAFDAAAPVPDFTVGFRPDGVDPVAPIPREVAYLVMTAEGQTPYTQMLGNPPDAGEVRTTDCVMTGFKRHTSTESWKVQAIGFMFNPASGVALRSLIEK